MPSILSHRAGYVTSPQLPLERIAGLGIGYLEIVMKEGETAADIKALLEPHGLQVSTIHAHPTLIGEEVFFETLKQATDLGAELGAFGLFVSIHVGEFPLEEAYERLRKGGDIVAGGGLFMAMETHPDLCENGDKAAETLEAVNHPAVGWNLDTANIYYYNEDVNAAEEARKAAKWVRAVHAKDTTGGFKDPNFPNLGEGVVDFAGVAEVLAEVGFDGPWTMELEGVAGAAESVDLMEQNVRICAEHLRWLGLVE